ncbi:hypothetical protein II810_04260 [bacterium]|nr:hypothetical protein [bacterium]
MLLFIISFCLIFSSSYFLASILNKEKNILGLIYTFIFAFANIILTMEVLSLFSAIEQKNVLLCNILIFTLSLILWFKNGKPLAAVDIKNFCKKFWTAINLDKSLMILSVCFLVFILSSIFMCIVFPVVSSDAGAYHVLRSLFWIGNKNLSHFPIADLRNLYLPINSELIYTWIFLFLKKEVFISFPSFFGYIISIISVYKILDMMKYSMRKKLWVIYILSSFAFVCVQASSTETDIINAGLVTSSIYMFLYGIKNKKEIPVIISALSYAIAIGVKTPSIFTIPMIALGFGIFAYKKLGKKDFYKPLLRFLAYGFVFFIIFSAYNYVQNYLEVGNIAGNKAFLIVHRNLDGLKALPSTFIKHLFLLVDFTGFHWGYYLGSYIVGFRDAVINHLGIFNAPDGVNSTSNYAVNQSLFEQLMGPGVLGILVLIPSLIISLVKPVFKRNYRTLVLFFFGLIFLGNIAVLSYAVPFMAFSVRFLMYFTVISAPILVYSYSKKGIWKNIIIVFSMFYLTMIPTHIWARNITLFLTAMKSGISVSTARDIARCTGFGIKYKSLNKQQYEMKSEKGKCVFENSFKKYFPTGAKILIFSNSADELLDFKLLQFYGYTIDTNLFENVDNINFDNYDVVITVGDTQLTGNFSKYKTGIPMPDSIDCIYLAGVQFSDISKQYPNSAICTIDHGYFKTKGFDGLIKTKYSIIPFHFDNKGQPETPDYAFIYYRTNNRPIEN